MDERATVTRNLGARMRILFIGGTGLISTACTELAIQNGFDIVLLNRGQRKATPRGARSIVADIRNPLAAAEALKDEKFDAVVNWIAFTPAEIERDIELFRGRTRQYIFISSASVYQKPATDYLITESTPLANPHWEYSRNKIACEERLMLAYRQEQFPFTIVRPSLTYGDEMIPLAVNSWARPYTIPDRMKRGLPVIVHGDGSSLWTVTHNTDFAKGLVGLLGHQQAIGHSFHITSDEVLCWDQIYTAVADALGVKPRLYHIASDFLAAVLPHETGGLQGDKSPSSVFDNSKIKRFVPSFVATTSFATSIRKTLKWFESDPARMAIDEAANRRWDALIAAHESGIAMARKSVG
jgi:nucleoside-diphosphate-sugar epimerase